MRLKRVETGHSVEAKLALAEMEAAVGHVDGVDLLLAYRPDRFGDPFTAANQEVMLRASEWTPGDRELFAAFVSSVNQCPF